MRCPDHHPLRPRCVRGAGADQSGLHLRSRAERSGRSDSHRRRWPVDDRRSADQFPLLVIGVIPPFDVGFGPCRSQGPPPVPAAGQLQPEFYADTWVNLADQALLSDPYGWGHGPRRPKHHYSRSAGIDVCLTTDPGTVVPRPSCDGATTPQPTDTPFPTPTVATEPASNPPTAEADPASGDGTSLANPAVRRRRCSPGRRAAGPRHQPPPPLPRPKPLKLLGVHIGEPGHPHRGAARPCVAEKTRTGTRRHDYGRNCERTTHWSTR